MSVKGEFVRIVGDAVECLREVDSERADGLASDLERARQGASQDLPGAAARVMELWDDGLHAGLADAAAARERLADAGERMLAVSRIILGR